MTVLNLNIGLYRKSVNESITENMGNDLIIKKLVAFSEIFKKMQNVQIGGI